MNENRELPEVVAERLDSLLHTRQRTLCVIDGCCGSGKTTLAEALSRRYGHAPVIHMDDFFLPPALRTPQRLETPGGNVHHERFAQQVIEGLRSGASFPYQRYDCATGSWQEKTCPAAPLILVEGSYSLHPALQPAWQELGALTVFLSVDGEEQKRRIARRSPQKLEVFVNRWIPLEKKYFQAYDIKSGAQLALTSQPREDM